MFAKSFGRPMGVVRSLVVINVAIFVLELLLPGARRWIDGTFGLSWAGLQGGMLWQLVTHQFLHGSLFHLFVNMLGLWFSGRILENLMGGRRFLILYLTCGIAGGLLQVLLVPGTILIGASGAVFGVVCAFSALFPEMRITAMVFFIIPVNLKAKWLGWGLVAISFLFTISGLGGNIGHAAHLGGALTGYAFVYFGRTRGFRIVRRSDL